MTMITRTLFKTTGNYTDIELDENGQPKLSNGNSFEIYTTTKPTRKDINNATNNAKAVFNVVTEELVLGATIDEFVKIAKPVNRPKSQSKTNKE